MKKKGDWHSAEQKRLSIVFVRGVAQSLKTKVFKPKKIWAIGAVGSALERHSRGHKFEPCIAHHKKEVERPLFYGQI